MSIDFLSDLVITKVYSASTLYSPKDAENKRYDRPCWAIVIKYEGETVYTVNKNQYQSDAHHIIILPKGCSYEWKCTKAGHFSIIEFESSLTGDLPYRTSVKNTEKILKAFKELEYKRTVNGVLTDIESIRDAYSILLMLMQSATATYLPADKHRKIAPALEYITKHYTEKIRNDELAKQTGFSTVYFRKLFTETMGQSPIDYIQSVRIGKAKEILKSDYGSISDVALTLGYQSIYDFSRAFKKHTGKSPSQYKKQKK